MKFLKFLNLIFVLFFVLTPLFGQDKETIPVIRIGETFSDSYKSVKINYVQLINNNRLKNVLLIDFDISNNGSQDVAYRHGYTWGVIILPNNIPLVGMNYGGNVSYWEINNGPFGGSSISPNQTIHDFVTFKTITPILGRYKFYVNVPTFNGIEFDNWEFVLEFDYEEIRR